MATMVFFLLGGVQALLMRTQLIRPENTFLSPQTYNEVFTMHGTTMIFLVVMPMLIGLATYLVPLQVGARDIAFPRMNAMSFWFLVFGGLLLYYSYLAGGAPDAGWFSYAPLSERPFSMTTGRGLLGARAPRDRHRHDHGVDQSDGHDPDAPRPGADAHAAAAVHVDGPRQLGARAAGAAGAERVAGHAADRPAAERARVRAGRAAAPRCCGSTTSGRSAIRKSTSWCCRRSGLSPRSSRCSPASRSTATSSSRRPPRRSRSSAWRCGRTTCSRPGSASSGTRSSRSRAC